MVHDSRCYKRKEHAKDTTISNLRAFTLNRNRLYVLLFIACIAGYIWLYYNISNTSDESTSVGVCFIKNVTSISCPSCGTTRSVISLTKGHFFEALTINPLGFVVGIIMLVAPFWISIDVLTGKNNLFNFYKKVEIYLTKKKYAIPLIVLVIINWIWNITKGL